MTILNYVLLKFLIIYIIYYSYQFIILNIEKYNKYIYNNNTFF